MGEGCHDIARLVLKYISFISEYFIYFTSHVYLVLIARSKSLPALLRFIKFLSSFVSQHGSLEV
jgi:hypothetical protein